MNFKKTAILLLFSLLVLTACNSRKNKVIENKTTYEVPRGMVELDDNFFVDSLEMRNQDWLEYLYWTQRMYGQCSKTYKDALPDTSVWEAPNEGYIEYYLRHPNFREYPIVGITYQQALKYCRWRSDRVLQMMLVNKKIMDWPDIGIEDSSNFFTLEKYYEGKYNNLKPDFNLFYPEYTLPTIDEWNNMISKTEAFNKNEVYIHEKKLDNGNVKFEVTVSGNEKPKEGCDRIYTVPANIDPKSKIIFHLYDNVSEISKDKGIALGGNWNLVNKGIFGNVISTFDEPNAWTGFRMVCRWKKYNTR